MTIGLQVARLINVTVNLSPLAAQAPNLNSMMLLGDSDVIDVTNRIRSYSSLAAVAADFGTTATEYLAAVVFFGQKPQPNQLYIGKWARVAVAGRLVGGALSAAQQAIAVFNAVVSGGFKIQVDAAGAPVNVAGINLSASASLNAVATAINTALVGAAVGAVCSWTGTNFLFKSNTTGATSKVQPLTPPTAGTDLGVLLNGTVALGAQEVDGIAPETALAAVTLMDNMPTYWYGLHFAASVMPSVNDNLAVAGFVEGAANRHAFGYTTSDANALVAANTTDIGYQMAALGYLRTWGQYSSSSPYAGVSMLARLITTDFTQNNSVITLAYKQEPGIVAENLTATQAASLDAKRYNYFANYSNGTAILMNGTAAGSAWIDEVFGTDWLAAGIQTDLYNALYLSTTKIPQTDAGNHQLATVIENRCIQGVTNGLLAGGTWTAGGFGQLATGDFLAKGYYVYTPPIASQSVPDRAARKSVSFQVAAKLAGAIQSVVVAINVNR